MIAGEEWHRGVIGIVASRLVERFHRPVVLIAGGEPGEDWVGSGRSVSAFDLHGALGACSHLLGRWGGHRAAAGLSIAPENVEAFAEAFAEHAARHARRSTDLRPVTPVDAVVRGSELTLGLCEELERLAPFGLGNPNVTLLAVGAELSELDAVGEGKHLRLAVTAAGARSGAIAFGRGAALDRFRRPGRYDVAFRLAANHWNGTVTPQLVVREIFDTPPRFEELRRMLARRVEGGPGALGHVGARGLRGAGARRGRRRLAPARGVAGVPRGAPRDARGRSGIGTPWCPERGPEPAAQGAKMSSWRVRCSRASAERHREQFDQLVAEVAAVQPRCRSGPPRARVSLRLARPTSTSSAGAARTSSSTRSASR